MPPEDIKNSNYFKIGIVAVFVAALSLFFFELRPVNGGSTTAVVFEVKSGDGLVGIADALAAQGLIRSRLAFEIWSVADGAATGLRPGIYAFDPAMSAISISSALASGGHDITVTIPEGWNIFQIDKALSDALVIQKGDLIRASENVPDALIEGSLFPDTYQFRNDEPIANAIQTLTDNFNKKAGPLFVGYSSSTEEKTLIVASILEKEAPNPTDQSIIAGIIQKRLASGIALGIDATVCYAKQLANPNTLIDCAKLTSADFKIDSPYNTYAHRGLPPGPIGNPGISAITAAENTTATPYLYYLSDPATRKIIYARTLQEQNQNIQKYLRE